MDKRLEIRSWRPMVKNTLRGFFTVVLPSGLIINECSLHERNGARWISFPAREYSDAQGQRKWETILTFRDSKVSDKFRDLTLAALDEYHERHAIREEQAGEELGEEKW
jgi:hypothetical protein